MRPARLPCQPQTKLSEREESSLWAVRGAPDSRLWSWKVKPSHHASNRRAHRRSTGPPSRIRRRPRGFKRRGSAVGTPLFDVREIRKQSTVRLHIRDCISVLQVTSSPPISRLYCSCHQQVGGLERGEASASRGVLIGGVCLDGCRLSTGSVKKKVVPTSGCDSAQIRPPCA
jgi:hypothetical protein